MKAPRVSNRGQHLLANAPFPEYLQQHFERRDAACGPANPEGYIPLSVAENLLLTQSLIDRLTAVRDVPTRILAYDSMVGSENFRRQLARFFGRRILGVEPQPEQLAALAGAGSVLEILFHCLCDPGDGVLVPTPSYAGFWADLETRAELKIVEVPTMSHEDFRLTPDQLDHAVRSAGRPVKALLFTSPNNPLGTVYVAEEIEEILDWAENRGLHVVFDEIYALSVFGDQPFISCTDVIPRLGDRVHVVWAFSKDFGASGLRCGVLLSDNQQLLEAVDALAYWACCSGLTQYLLGEVISDDAWIDAYIADNQKALGQAYRGVTAALDAEGIPYFPAEAGFFLLLDLRDHLSEPDSWPAEEALWRCLLEDGNVNLTPGRACRNAEPGLLRLCFAAVPTEVAVAGVERIGRILAGQPAFG